MGRQVRFRNHPDDLSALLAYIDSVGGVVLGQPTDSPEPRILDSLDLFQVPDLGDRRTGVIARSVDLPRLHWSFVEARGGWLIGQSHSPVVEYSPGYDPPAQPFGSDDQRRGRMWFATSYLKDGEIVPAPDEFVRWAVRLPSWIRRNWTSCGDHYASPRAVESTS